MFDFYIIKVIYRRFVVVNIYVVIKKNVNYGIGDKWVIFGGFGGDICL